MEDEITTETKPRRFKLGRVLPVDALITDPSVTVIEIGETLGFLLSESCYDSETGNFILENVAWCRYIVQKRESLINRSFSKVELYLHNSGIFVAQDTLSKNYLPYPSAEFYWVIFIDMEQYSEIQKVIEKKAREEFWLNQFQSAADLKFEIDDKRELRERPDFLIRYQGRIVGVEVTELQIDCDRSPSKGSTL